MKFFSWMQNKLQNGKGNAKPNASSSASHHTNPEQRKEECSDWHHGLLTIGTFGNNDLKENQASQSVEDDEQCVSPDLAEFTPEVVGKLEKELTKLLSRKPAAAKVVGDITNLPLDRFLNCPSSLEVDRRLSNALCSNSNNRDEEEDIDRTIRVILGRCRDACMERNNKSLGKKSVSFLLKKMFVCASGFAPAPNLRDAFHESRMEKLMRTMLSKKMYPQNACGASSVKRYIENVQQPKTSSAKQDETEEQPNGGGSKWDKTDCDYIVLEI